ncbi:MAG TPA: CHAT domain-containing protein [Pyrinomonadaceae bacterium]|nr:CHAT domain-containing protein [Pyrinomonadaceae bacterium]
MSSNRDDRSAIREFLLGNLREAKREEFEQRLLVEDGVFDEVMAAEDELIDQYLAGELNTLETQMFNNHFLATSERQRQLRFAKALRKYALAHASKDMQLSHETVRAIPARARGWWPLFSAPAWKVAAVAAVLVIAAVGVWRMYFYQSDVAKGLIALNAAYREQRPIEARITQLNYAPFVTTRGNESARVNSLELERAERILRDAVHDRPGAASYHALGNFYVANKDFDKAISQFGEALNFESNNAQIYADLGAAFLERAKLLLRQSNLPEQPEHPATPSSNGGKGSQDLGRALENFNKAIELNGSLLEAQFNRALCYQYMMVPKQAADAWKKYLEQDSTSAWAEEARRNLRLIENQRASASETEQRLFEEFQTAYERGDDDSAWQALSQSRARAGNLITDRLLDCFLSADGNKCDRNLKQISYAGKLELARSGDHANLDISDFYDRATLHERQALGSARAQIKAGVEAFNKGEFDSAIALLVAAHNSFTKIGEPAEALMAQSWEGYARLRVPQKEESLALFQAVFNESAKRDYSVLKAQALNALADAKLSSNAYSEALAYANRCSRLSAEICDRTNQIRCLAQSQSLELIFGDYAQSLELMRNALTISQDLPWQPRLIWPLYHEGALAANFLDLPASAVAFEEEALRLADVADVPLLRSRTWERLGMIYGEQKNHEAALNCGERALSEAQKISGELSRKNVLAHSMLMLGDLHREAGNLQKSISYFDQASTLYQELHFDAYSYTAHKGKFLALNALNETALAAAELPIVLQLFEDNRTRIVEESNRDKFFDAQQNTYDLAADFAFSKMRDEKQSFNYIETSKARSLIEMMTTGAQFDSQLKSPETSIAAETTPLTLAEIQRLMPEQTQLLEYAVLSDKMLIWVVSNSAFAGKEIPLHAGQLAEKIRALNNSIAQGAASHGEFLSRAKDLHDQIIRPIEGLLRKDRQLVIVADKSLNYLPFSALISTSSGRYLIEDYQLQMTPSATVFVACCKEARARNTQTEERILSVGNPRFDQTRFPGLPDLPAAAREAEESASFYGRKTVLTKGEALKGRVTKAFTTSDVVHLATHAVTDERSPLLSKLLLAHDTTMPSDGSDGELLSVEIHQLKLPRTRLVVLSACQTGVEHAYSGEGAIGLARPFLAARVPLVVASLWPVDSELTAELMVQFHRFRKEGKLTTVAALQQAQLAMLHNPQPAFRENSGWAAFTVIGGYATF